MFPLHSRIKSGLRVAGNSDSPASDYRPLFGIAAALSRETQRGQVLAPEERLTLEEALHLYATHLAWLSFAENELGKLAPGFRANLVVLGEDVMSMTNPSDIRDCPVAMTVIDGVPV